MKKKKKTKSNITSGSQSPAGMQLTWANDFLFDQYPDAILIADDEGIILDVNSHLQDMVGYTKSEMVGQRIEMLMPKKYRSGHVAKYQGHMKNDSGRAMETGVKFLAEHKDGTTFPIDIMLTSTLNQNSKITVTIIRDISKIHAIQAREKKAKDTLSAVIDAAPVAIFVISRDKIILSWSQDAENLFGYSASEVVNKPYKLVPAENTLNAETEFNSLFTRVLSGKTTRDVHRKRLHKDGHMIDVAISAAPMHDLEGNVHAIACCAQDISQRLLGEEKLNQIAYFDQISGLPNREHLKKDLQQLLGPRLDTIVNSCFLAKIELEGIVEVRNMLGQDSADNLILEITKRLNAPGFSKAKFYHTNRYEFAMIVPNWNDQHQEADLIEPLIEQINLPFEIEGQIIHLGVNVGMAISPEHGDNVDELLANASLALLTAKANPMCTYILFDVIIRAHVNSKRELDLGLRRAYENNEFELFYQPQFRLSDGALIGAEALLRWRHPTRGLMLPFAFIDTLARHPISYDVGNWVMQTALKQAAKWRAQNFPDLRMGVNLFSSQFERATLVDDVEKALSSANLPANALELEITENIAIGFDKTIIDPLKTLRAKGVGIAFDDFGTGFASLSYLVKYPLSRIKIDRSFLRHIPGSKEEQAIVQATISMAHELGLEVIAEGVETLEHVAFLKEQKCEEAQGYYYAKPLPVSDFEEFAKTAQYRTIAHRLAALSMDGA